MRRGQSAWVLLQRAECMGQREAEVGKRGRWGVEKLKAEGSKMKGERIKGSKGVCGIEGFRVWYKYK